MNLKLGMGNRRRNPYKVHINDDTVLNFTYFMARSNFVSCVYMRKHYKKIIYYQ